MPSELEKSYELVGRIFAMLVDTGLRKAVFGSKNFGLAESDPFFSDVMAFLIDEQLVRIGGQSMDGEYYQVQLTSAGLKAIDSARFGDGQSVRSTIEEKRGELSSATYGKIGSLIGGVIGGVTKAIGN